MYILYTYVVHAYERSYPVYQFNPTPVAPAYVMVGTGADSIHDNVWLNQTAQPVWSAYRNGTQWGTGTLIPASRSKMTWAWHWNLDGILVSADEVTICNTALGYPTYCEGLQFQCTLKLRGASKAAWTAKSSQLLVNLTSAATGVSASQMLVRKPHTGASSSRSKRAKGGRLLGELIEDESGDGEDEDGAESPDAEGDLRALWAADGKNGLRGAGLRVVLEAFGLPGEKKGNTNAAAADAQAIEAFLNSASFVSAFGNGVVAASARCNKPRFGTYKL